MTTVNATAQVGRFGRPRSEVCPGHEPHFERPPCTRALELAASDQAVATHQAFHVSRMLVSAVLEVVQRRGFAPPALALGGADAWRSSNLDGRVSIDAYQHLLARAIRVTGDPALGLQCGLLASESSFGLMSPLVSHAPNLRTALELMSQFHELLAEGVNLRLSERLGVAQLRCKLLGATDRSLLELMIAGLVRALRAFGCQPDELHAVCFEHARPAHYRAYTAAFGGRERFGQSFTGVEFAAQALDRPHMHGEPELHALMRAAAERSMQRLARAWTCTQRVRALLRNRHERHAPDMLFVARELGLSVRSLRRRLEEEGTSYRELTQAQLFESACSMLRNQAFSLQAVAHALGFADASSFHRAFRRWSGVTPAEFRERRGPAAPSSAFD